MMEIQRADRRLRMLLVLAFVGAVAVGAVGLSVFEGWLDEVRQLAPADARRALRSAFLWVAGGAFATSLLPGVYLWRFGSRTRSAARFPPPGARVIRDTAILQGDAARRRGGIIQGLGVLLTLCALGLLAMSWLLYTSVFANAT